VHAKAFTQTPAANGMMIHGRLFYATVDQAHADAPIR
jgi:hypothetical protein